LIGAALERSLYRHLYTRSHLDKVLFSVGLVFMSVAGGRLHHGIVADIHKTSQCARGQIDFISAIPASGPLPADDHAANAGYADTAHVLQWCWRARIRHRRRQAVDESRARQHSIQTCRSKPQITCIGSSAGS